MVITDALISAIHYLGFMGLFAVLAILHLILNDEATTSRARRVLVLCYIFLGSWVITLATGLLKVFVLAPSALYLKNGLFHLKLTLFFVMIALFSPLFTKALKNSELPKWIKHTLRMNLLIIVIIPLLASLMARGIGFWG